MRPLVRLAVASAVALPFLAAIVIKLMWPLGGLMDVTGHALGRDFVNVWNGARLALAGETATLFDLDAYRASLEAAFWPGFKPHNWSYPPHALMLFLPFGALTYPAALAVWTVGGLAALLAAVAVCVPGRNRLLAMAVAAAAPASLVDVAFGQNGHLTAALLLGGLALLDRRPVLAGVLFGLLTIKPHLGLLLPFALVAVGAWRAVLSAAVTTLVLVGLSALAFGTETWRLYFEVTTGMQAEILANARGMLIVMMPTVFQAAKSIASHEAAALAQLVASALAIPLGIWIFRRAPDAATRAVALCAAGLIALPYAFNYDMVALSGAIVWRAAARDCSNEETLALAFAFVAPAVMMVTGLFDAPIGPLALTAALGACALRIARREAPAEADVALGALAEPAKVG